MWDSAGAAATPPPTSERANAATAAPLREKSEDPAELSPSRSGTEPGQGDNVERIDVQVTKESLTIVPDAKMLAGTSASAFPLFIDPPVTWGGSERTLLRSDGYESYGWSNGDDDRGKGVGECGTWNGYYCGPG
ncbi:hypothetical protein ACFWJY_05425 [Streptomyces anulatus]|uniref:hypothetical protein n=1 Tax=Streptomyces anulatus TaxID=1892 RepID=UPI0036547A19